MLYAKIDPTAKIGKQETPFNISTREASYMRVIANPYGAGTTIIKFDIEFGEIQWKDEEFDGFELILTTKLTLTDNDISAWGTDDTVLLSVIAEKIGTTIVSFFSSPDNY